MRRICLVLLALVLAGFATPSAREPVLPREAPAPAIHWRSSIPLGAPDAGRLVRGVLLPAGGPAFFTWDPLLHRRPDRATRRWGTDDLVRIVLRVIRDYAKAHPGSSRVGIGDLSRKRGGWFGPRHASHQNGLDADIYYPRLDGRERPPRKVAQVNLRLAQDLVDRFVAAGATIVFVGPNTGLSGPDGIVQVLANHDNHLHVRI